MELFQYVKVLRRRKVLVATPLLLAVATAAAFSLLAPRTYASSTTLFYSQGSTSASTQDDQRLASYVSLAQSPRVASAVISRLHLKESVRHVRDSLSAATSPGTLLVVVTAKGRTPQEARQVATIARDELVRLAGDLERAAPSNTTTALRVAQAATPATRQSTLLRNLGLGLAIGLFIGIVLAFVREGFDDRVTTDDQLLGDQGLRTLARLVVRHDEQDALALLAGPRGPMDPAFLRLRLALHLTGSSGPRVLVAAACSADAGATTMTSGLGLTLADAGLRVIVICADPARETGLGEQTPAGLTEVLGGHATLHDTLRATSHESMRRLSPGRDASFLDELLCSAAMTKLLVRLQGDADVVLVDVPPLPESVAGPLLAESTGADVVLVVRSGETRRDQVARAVGLVEQARAPLLGVVLTFSPASPRVRPQLRRVRERVAGLLATGLDAGPRSGGAGSSAPDPTKPDPTKPDPTKPDPTKPDPTKPEPTKPEPTKPEPTKPATKPEPAKPATKPDPTAPNPTKPAPPRRAPAPRRPPKPGSSRGGAARAALLRGARDPSSALLVAQLAVASAALVANILASRSLAPDGRGELALLLQIAYLSSLGLVLGIDRSVVAVFAGSARREAVHAVRRLLHRPVLVTVALAAVAVAVLPMVHRTSWWPFVLLVAAFSIVNAFVRSMRSVAIATGRHRDFVWFTVAGQLLLLATMTVLFVVGVTESLLWLAAYLVAGALPTALCFLVWLRADATAVPSTARLDAARREGLALLPAAVADSGMLRLDRLLLPIMFSTSALGIYAGVGTMTELLAWPMIAYADARVGIWRVAADAGLLRTRRVLLPACAYVVVAGVLMALAIRALVVPLLGDSYAPARRLVVPLIAAAAVYGLGQVLASLLIAWRRGAGASKAATVGFVVSAVAYVLLIPRHAAEGAAYGSLGGYSASLVCAAAFLVAGGIWGQDRLRGRS